MKHTSIPTDLLNAKSARVAREVAAAQRVAAACMVYAAKLQQRGEWSPGVEYARFTLANEIIGLFDDGDALAVRDIIMSDLGINEDGDPVDENGFPRGSLSVSMEAPCLALHGAFR